jgi:hypothetical protein
MSGNDRWGGRGGDANGMRFWGWQGPRFSTGLSGGIVLRRPRATRRSVLRVFCILCVLRLLFLFLLHCSLLLFLFLLLHLYFYPRVGLLHDICICRVEHRDIYERRLTGLPRVNGTSTTSVRRSGNSMPSSCRLFFVVEKVFLTHSRKRSCAGEPPTLSLLPRNGEEMRPGDAR